MPFQFRQNTITEELIRKNIFTLYPKQSAGYRSDVQYMLLGHSFPNRYFQEIGFLIC